MKVVELTVSGEATPSGVTSGMKVCDTPLSVTTVNSHLLNSPVILHVSSNGSPTWHTSATPSPL